VDHGRIVRGDDRRALDGRPADDDAVTAPTPSTDFASGPYAAEIDLERERWSEIETICRSLDAEQRERHGYFHDPDWSVKDMVGHLGAWMADAYQQLLRIEAGTWAEEPADIDAKNARYLAALHDQEWSTVWTQAISARTQMLRSWERLPERSAVADSWVRKAGAEHHEEHLPRLRAWVEEMRAAP
jgi:hypothetical protein